MCCLIALEVGPSELYSHTPLTACTHLPLLPPPPTHTSLLPGEDRRTSAARCLGELVRKMGERVLGRIIPILQQHMADPAPSTRQGVCAGLREVRQRHPAALRGACDHAVAAGRSCVSACTPYTPDLPGCMQGWTGSACRAGLAQ